MKKSYLFILAFTLIAGVLCSCHINRVQGNGTIVSQEVTIGDYNKLHIEGENIDLTYIQSDDAPYLKVETDQNIMAILNMEVVGKELVIRSKHKYTGIKPTRFVITTNSTALRKFRMAGDGNCNLGQGITGDKLDIKMAGGGAIKADSITVDRLKCEIAGSGAIYLSGTAKDTDIKSAGSCKIKAFDLQTDNLHCKSAGSCNIEITANETISTKIAGSGTIRYKGNPNIKEKSIAGSGTIVKVD